MKPMRSWMRCIPSTMASVALCPVCTDSSPFWEVSATSRALRLVFSAVARTSSMVVELSASSLKQVSDLRLALLQEAKVQSVTVYTATTGQTTTDGTVSASMVIHVAQEGTAGGASK